MELIDAAKNGNLETVLTLLESGCAPNSRDKDNATPLYWSACHGHDDVTEILITAGCDVNAMVRWGSTALHAAADRGRLQCVQILINNGANTNSTNNRGDTPLHISAYRGFMEITRILLLAGSDVSLTNEKGKTPQEEALEGGNSDIARCIHVFVTEGHFSLPNGQNHYSTILRDLRTSGDTIVYNTMNTQTQNISSNRNNTRRLNSVASECSDVTESITSSVFTSESSSAEDSVESGTMLDVIRRPSSSVQLKRSVSFGGSHHRDALLYNDPSVSRTSSVENVQNQLHGVGRMIGNNDINIACPNYISEPIGRLRVVNKAGFQNGALNTNGLVNYETNRSPGTQMLFSPSGQSFVTECVDYTNGVHGNNQGGVESHSERVQILRRMKPQRSSIGSMGEIVPHGKDGVIKLLQTQLVDSYKQIENLSKENEQLKFKASTLLEKLSETEAKVSSLTVKCNTLTELLNAARKSPATLYPGWSNINHELQSPDDGLLREGFRELAERFTDKPSQLDEKLQDTLMAMSSKLSHTETLDEPTNEWLPGTDYVILGDPPVSAPVNEQLPKFVSFLVKHLKSNNSFLLKMAIELRTKEVLASRASGSQLKDSNKTSTNYKSYPNIIKIVHQFEASTDRLSKFVYIPPPTSIHLPQQELVERTTFLVTPFMLTLRKLKETWHGSSLVSTDDYLNVVFWIHVLYQLTSVLCLLENAGATFGELDEDTVGFDDELVPYLKNIENVIDIDIASRTNGQFHNYPNAEMKGNNDYSNNIQVTLQKSSSTNDIRRLCTMFHNVLFVSKTGNKPLIPERNQNVHYVTPIGNALRHILSDAKEPKSYLFGESNTATNILKRFGVLLFGPGRNDVSGEENCSIYRHTQMLKLLSEIPKYIRPSNRQNTTVGIEESVRITRCRIEAHFFCHVTGDDLWTVYRKFEQRGLFVK